MLQGMSLKNYDKGQEKAENESTKGTSHDTTWQQNSKVYKAEWSDLDTRPLPAWYDEAKLGIMLHWGVYSVPSFHSEWFWLLWNRDTVEIKRFMKKLYSPIFTYQEFAPMFTAEFFDPNTWATLFAEAGAKYVVLTTKHHDGYTLFPSRRSFSWNSVDVGPKRDLVAELAHAVKINGIKFGAYYSLYEWFNPLYTEDKYNNFSTRVYAEHKLWPELRQLITDYEPSLLWSDGDEDSYDTYWNSTGLLAWLYNESPVKNEIVVNDRWGMRTRCRHGDFYNCKNRYNPGELQKHKWENVLSLDRHSWGYRRTMSLDDVMTINELLKELVTTVSCGGNVLINVGPTSEGTIPVIFQDRLMALGEWLRINGEAIYKTSPWFYQNDTSENDIWYTCLKTPYDAINPSTVPKKSDDIKAIYVIALKWPRDHILRVKQIAQYIAKGKFSAELLGNRGALEWDIKNSAAEIKLPKMGTVTSKYAWIIKITSN